MKNLVARCIGLFLLPLGVVAQPILIAPQQNQVFPGSSLSNVRLLKESANGTEAVLTLSFVYDGMRGPTALLLPMITDRKNSRIAGWFGANPVTISSGRGTISLRVRFFNDDPGVPSELTTDHVRILMLTDGGNAVISEGIFPVTIKWGGAGAAPALAPEPQPDEQARVKAEEEKRIAEERAKTEVAREAAIAEQARQAALAEKVAEENAKAEAEAKVREEARLKAEAGARARQEAEAKRLAEAKAKAEAEAKTREETRLEAAAEEKAIEDARFKAEAEERARREAAAKRLAEAKAKIEAEAEAREAAHLKAEVEEKAREDAAAKLLAEEKAKVEAEAKAREEARIKAEAEEKARQVAEEKRLADEKAKAEVEAKAREEARLKAEAEAQARQEAAAKLLAEEKAKAEAEAKAREEARLKAEAEAKLLAEQKAKDEAEAKVQGEAANRLAEEKAAAAISIPKTGFVVSSAARTKVTNLDVVNRNLDRTEMTIAVEYEYSKGDGPVRMGVDVATTSDPDVSKYFSCTPVNIGKGSRNFVMFPVKLDTVAAQSLKRPTLPTDKVWIYIVNAAGEKSYIFQGTMMLVWHIPGGDQEAPDASWAAAVRNSLEIESFKQNDLFSGYVTVKYNLRSSEGHLHLTVYDSANPATANWLESDDIPIKSGPGLQLVRIDVPKKASSPDVFNADTVEIQMLDASGTLLASSHNQSPMSWAKPK